MAYATSNPPACILPSLNGVHPSIWSYRSTDAAAVVDADGYITNAKDLGMRAGDIVFVTDTDASPLITTTHLLTEMNTDGSADLSNLGATVGSTNSD